MATRHLYWILTGPSFAVYTIDWWKSHATVSFRWWVRRWLKRRTRRWLTRRGSWRRTPSGSGSNRTRSPGIAALKGLSCEIDIKSVDKKGQILDLIRAAAGFPLLWFLYDIYIFSVNAKSTPIAYVIRLILSMNWRCQDYSIMKTSSPLAITMKLKISPFTTDTNSSLADGWSIFSYWNSNRNAIFLQKYSVC